MFTALWDEPEQAVVGVYLGIDFWVGEVIGVVKANHLGSGQTLYHTACIITSTVKVTINCRYQF